MNRQQRRIAQYLKEHKSASTNELRNQLGIAHPDTIVSRLRAIYGRECIVGTWMKGKNKFGEETDFMMYTLSEQGRAAMFPVKPPLPDGVFNSQEK